MALEKDAYTDIGLFKPSVFGCNINSFSLTEGCPLSLWMTAVQNSPNQHPWTIFWTRLISPDTAIETMIRGSFCRLTFLKDIIYLFYSSHGHGGIVKSRLKSSTYSSDHLNCLQLFRSLCQLRMSEWRSLLAVYLRKQ